MFKSLFSKLSEPAKDAISNTKFVEMINSLEKGATSPFVVLDVRTKHEIEDLDLPKYNKNDAVIPKVNIEVGRVRSHELDLIESYKDSFQVICLC